MSAEPRLGAREQLLRDAEPPCLRHDVGRGDEAEGRVVRARFNPIDRVPDDRAGEILGDDDFSGAPVQMPPHAIAQPVHRVHAAAGLLAFDFDERRPHALRDQVDGGGVVERDGAELHGGMQRDERC